jgi:hypothetical protein
MTLGSGSESCSAFCACWSRRLTFTAFVFIGGLFFLAMVYGAWIAPTAALLLALPVASVFSDFAYLVNETYYDTGLFAASMFSMALPFAVFLARLFADECWSALSYHPGNVVTAMCGGTSQDVPTLWLGKHVQGVPTYAGRRLLRGMQLNKGPLSLGAFVLSWAMFALLQIITLFLYILWVFLLFPIWLPVLLAGYFFYQTKVLALRRTQNAWIGLWSMNYAQLVRDVPVEESVDYVWLLESISADILLRALPQLFIQYWNNTRRQQWSMLGQISFLITAVLVIFYFLYKLLALCFPSLRPEGELDEEEDEDDEEETAHGSPGSHTPRRLSVVSRHRRNPSSEHGLEMTDLYPDDAANQQLVAKIASDVKYLTAKFESADKELWLLLVGDQPDLRAVTLMRAYGLVKPKGLTRCSDHNLQQLRALIAGVSKEEQAEPENKLRGAHFDRLCVKMREENPEVGIVGMVKGAVAYVSGRRDGDTIPPPQSGLFSYLVPMLVRSDSRAAVAIRQKSRNLNLRELGDLDENDKGDGGGEDSPDSSAPVSFVDFLAECAVNWWQARAQGFTLFSANARWIFYGEADAPEGSEGAAPGVRGVLVRLSGSSERALVALQTMCVEAYAAVVRVVAASPEGDQGTVMDVMGHAAGTCYRAVAHATQVCAATAVYLLGRLCTMIVAGVGAACGGLWYILHGDPSDEAEPSDPWSTRLLLLAEGTMSAIVVACFSLRWIVMGDDEHAAGEEGEVQGIEGVGIRLYGASLRTAASLWEYCVWGASACVAGIIAAPAFARRCWNGDPQAGSQDPTEGSAPGLRGVCVRIAGSSSRGAAAIGEASLTAAEFIRNTAAACTAGREGEDVPPMHIRALSAVAGAGRAAQAQATSAVHACAAGASACVRRPTGDGAEGRDRTVPGSGAEEDDRETAYERFRRLSNEASELFLSFFG